MTEQKLDPGKLAAAYRSLVLWFGVQLAVAILGTVASLMAGETILGAAIMVVRLIVVLATIVPLVFYAYRTAEALGSRSSAVWAVAMLLPLVNIVTLLALSSKATAACRAAGIEVGFLGPKLDQATGTGD